MRIQGFNPRARTGRDRFVRIRHTPRRIVSIHAPARGATSQARARWMRTFCFNPRARTGRDNRTQWRQIALFLVSIHAPARGATHSIRRITPQALFQSTRPHGARHSGCLEDQLMFIVSIHAPARGATSRQRRGRHLWQRFNPRARTGRDVSPRGGQRHSPGFNPRARTGRDLARESQATGPALFQSTRPHGARRRGSSRRACNAPVSIHAPARGATTYPLGPRRGSRVSIHAPARGATSHTSPTSSK